jgi:hypothetical protein
MEALVYRNVGDYSEVCGHKLNRFGQSVDLTDEQADEAIVGGAELLPEADFNDCGFTADELKKYPNPLKRMKAPEEFIEKYREARAKVAARREELLNA